MSKKDLIEYLNEDNKVNHFYGFKSNFSVLKKYLNRLRKTEYLFNCKKCKIRVFFSKFFLSRLSVKVGITIGINCFGKGLYIPHYGYIVCNKSCRFGDYCTVQCGVNISEGASGGDNIFFGTGSKIMRNVRISSFAIIGANAVVTKSILEDNSVVVGVPATVISYNGMKNRKRPV